MGENYGFCGVVPAKYSLHGCCWQNIDSVRLAFGILKCSGRNKSNYGDSGFARMTNKNKQGQYGDSGCARMTTLMGDVGKTLIRCGLFG